MGWSRRAALAACLLVSVPAVLAAQARARHGSWFGIGLGRGSVRLSCTVCRDGRDGGTSGYLRAGATASRQVLVGGEVTVWAHSENQLDFLFGSVMAVVIVYPRPAKGFFLKTGLGLSRYTAEDPNIKVSSQAIAAAIGLGYDIPVTGGVLIVPFASFLGTTGGEVRVDQTMSGLSARTSLLQLGVGVTLP